MPAYLIVDVDVTDDAAFEEYRREVPAVDAKYGGHYLARGGAVVLLEGGFDPHRVVIVEFPDMAALMAWYHSPEYQRLKAVRERSAKTAMLAVEGV